VAESRAVLVAGREIEDVSRTVIGSIHFEVRAPGEGSDTDQDHITCAGRQ
jgi:hypothetical protein